jgi:4-diphosphocytidyl-2-C-methyl-D-erythritol kinase
MAATGIDDRFVFVQAPAKLNLFLEVRAKRPDGYHELETIMVGVSLLDSLRFRPTHDGQIEVHCGASMALGKSATAVPSGPANIAWQALDRLRSRWPDRALGGQLQIFKRIPHQAGLGGGSSDAAASLLAARKAWRLPTSDSELARIALEVGSDVPFFLDPRPAICRGRGERISAIQWQRPLWFVIAKPPIGLATADVYARLAVPRQPRSLDDFANALGGGSTAEIGLQLWNRLQGPAFELLPELRAVESAFARLDCCGHQLTGSGTAYFGLFANRSSASRAAGMLRSRLKDWFIASCHSLSGPSIRSRSAVLSGSAT